MGIGPCSLRPTDYSYDMSFWLNILTLMLSGLFFYLLLLIHTQPGSTLLPTVYAHSCRFLLPLAICAHNCKICSSTTFNYYQTLLWVFFSSNPNFLNKTEWLGKWTTNQQPTKQTTTKTNPYTEWVLPIYNFYWTMQGRLHTAHLLQVVFSGKKWLQAIMDWHKALSAWPTNIPSYVHCSQD